jgi:hypothetical protein
MGKLEELMNNMYLLELDITPELVQGGRLRVLVECWLSSLLRFWLQLKLLFPASVVNENLRRAVISSGLAANVPTAADAFLDKAGSAVAEAFAVANIGLAATCAPDGPVNPAGRPYRGDWNLVLCLPRLTVLVSIEADRPGAWFPGPLGPYTA